MSFYVASDKNWAFKWKLGFWETCILSIFKGFSDKAGSDTNIFVFFGTVRWNVNIWKIYIVSQYFPNDQCMILQNHA